MKLNEIRSLFIEFFSKNDHVELKEYSLIPYNDKSLLFTNSGMVQFKNIFLGIDNPIYSKVITVQRCVRLGGKHNDLDSIGTSLHHNTSFEMLGNFSFKNTSEVETIKLCWSFLINVLKLDINKLYVTVHKNDKHIFKIWHEIIKLSIDRIILGSDETNFWSMDENGPCGYCTEIFYDINNNSKFKENLLEIWNIVFIKFNKVGNNLNKLNNIYVDTGMGLERITSVMQRTYDNFKTDIYKSLIDKTLLYFDCNLDSNNERAIKIIVDHLKTSIMLIKEGIIPSNDGRGYVLKKLVRRIILNKNELKNLKPIYFLVKDYVKVFDSFKSYSDNDISFIEEIFKYEENKFNKTLSFGISFLKKSLLSNINVDGKLLFTLYDTYGLPIDVIKNVLNDYNISFDFESFNFEMNKQIINSRNNKYFESKFNFIGLDKTFFSGYKDFVTETKILKIIKNNLFCDYILNNEEGILVTEKTSFYAEKGGQISDVGIIRNGHTSFLVSDTQDINGTYLHFGKMIFGCINLGDVVFTDINLNHRLNCSSNHSATHLLNSFLKKVLGNHVKQVGSYVCNDYLRFDFTHFAALSKEDIFLIEKSINECILNNFDVEIILDYKNINFDFLRTVIIGDNISVEPCGGTHVSNTGKIGLFKILRDFGIGNNVRRIEATTGLNFLENFDKNSFILDSLSKKMKTKKDFLDLSVDKLFIKNKLLEKEINTLYLKEIKNDLNNSKYFFYSNKFKIVTLFKEKKYFSSISNIFSTLKQTLLLYIFSEKNNTYLNIFISSDIYSIKAIDITNFLSNFNLFKGNSKEKFATGVVIDVNETLKKIYHFLENNVN